MCKTRGIEVIEGKFQTGRQYMFEGQRVKPRNQFRLIGQDAFLGVAPWPRPSAALDAGEWRTGWLPRIVMLLVTAASRSVRL